MESPLVELIRIVIQHSYWFFFVATLIEGPLVTIAAGVASSLGYFNVWAIIAISIAGDVIADTVFYLIGYTGGNRFVRSRGSKWGLTESRMEKLGRLIHNHPGKAMTMIKLSPVIPIPGLIAVGVVRMSIARFLYWSLVITIPKTIVFGLFGYAIGATYEQFSGKEFWMQLVIFGIVPLCFLLYWLYKKFVQGITKNTPSME